jgi:Holliday junction resolvasome RuvABC DNA-binding subunit
MENSSKNESPQSEAVLALTALGYSNAQALKAVRAASALGFSEVEDLLKAALKELV